MNETDKAGGANETDGERAAADRSWTIRPGESKVIDVDDVSRLKVELVRGRVDVVGSDDPVAHVEVSNVIGLDVKVSVNADGRLRIDHPDAGNKLHTDGFLDGLKMLRTVFGKSDRNVKCSADVSLTVPRAIKAKIEMVHGDTLISGLTAGAKLDTVSGTVLADSLAGRLKLDTVSGRVEARNHHGDLDVNSVSGEVVFSGEAGEVEANTVSGDLYLDLFGKPSKLDVNAVSGSAVVRVDEGLLTVYRASALSGSVSVDGHRFKVPKSGFHYEDGPEDGPRLDVKFNAVSGSLKMVHRAAGAPVAEAPAAETPEPEETEE